MGADVWPDPLDQKPLKSLAQEGCKAKISKVILRLWGWDFIDGEVVFFFIGFGPLVGCNSLSINVLEGRMPPIFIVLSL